MFCSQVPEHMVVTAIDQSHIKEMYCMAKSAYNSYIYNFTMYELSTLDNNVKNIIKTNHPLIIMRKFQFNKYPPHVNISKLHNNGHYAWKPLIIYEMLQMHNNVIWLDAGTQLTSILSIEFMISKATQHYGIYSMQSSGTIEDWTHPDMITYFSKHIHVTDVNIHRKNCHAAMLSFTKSTIVYHIMKLWVKCALHLNCIEPCGASRTNHRQDQSALTIIIDHIERMHNIDNKICIDDPYDAWHTGLHHRGCDFQTLFTNFINLFY